MTRYTRLLVLSITTPLLVFALVGGFLGQATARESSYQHLRIFEDVVSLITSNYVEDVDADNVMAGALHGLAENLDPSSAYLSPEQVRVVEADAPPPEGNVGIELTRRYYLRVVAVRDGSPAARAGLATDDYIRAIGDRPTRTMTVFEGTQLLRGPVDSTVTLTVIRGNAADPREIELTREKSSVPTVSARLAATDVGYLRVPAFGPATASQIEAEVARLGREGVDRLILDVRDTAEGSLETGLDTAKLFVGSGTLATLEARDTVQKTIAAAAGDGAIALPVVVLVDGGTSGAAELFAAALVGHGRGELIGEPTSGRSAVQELVKLPDGSGLWLSRSRYFGPAHASIEGTGLEPTIAVNQPSPDFDVTPPEGDPVLERAVERLSTRAAV